MTINDELNIGAPMSLRAKTRDELVDEIDSRRAELQRRLDEAREGLELAFGPREPQRIETRGRKPKQNGSEFPERGMLDAESTQ